MSVYELRDPLTRLSTLPTLMNWRGGWGNVDQYYKNDIAVSPTNNASYILFGRTTDAGIDPIVNPAWFELFPHTTGLHQLQAGNGISITPVPSANDPTISNTGVRTLLANTGLGLSNTTVFNTGILGILADPSSTTGLFWDASATTLYNAGVITTLRLGITNTGTAQNQVWSNTGITGLIGSGNVSVAVDASGTATITNTGLVNVFAGAGIVKAGPTTTPTLGVSGGEVATMLHPTAPPTPLLVPYTLAPFSSATQPVLLDPNSLLAQQLANHSAVGSSPTWIFDFTPYWITWNDATLYLGGGFSSIGFQFVDTTTAGGPYTADFFAPAAANAAIITNTYGSTFAPLIAPPPLPLRANLGFLVAQASELWGGGIKTINEIRIINSVGLARAVNPAFDITIESWGDINARFFSDMPPIFS